MLPEINGQRHQFEKIDASSTQLCTAHGLMRIECFPLGDILPCRTLDQLQPCDVADAAKMQ
jgi:hypothetical protein